MSNKAIAVCVKIASEAHQHQFRWDGTPYMSHVVGVWNNVIKAILTDKLLHLTERSFALTQCAALLHDVIEDCMTREELAEKLKDIGDDGFEVELLSIVADELTHDRNVTYVEYVNAIHTTAGLVVKYCDMQHNMSCSMENILDNNDIVRASKQFKKYGQVINTLAQKLSNIRLF